MAVKTISESEVNGSTCTIATALDDNPGLLIKAGPTLLYGFHMLADGATAGYVKCFDAVALADVTLGTTASKAAFYFAGSTQLNIDLQKPLMFGKGLVLFSVTTLADNGTTAAAISGNIIWA